MKLRNKHQANIHFSMSSMTDIIFLLLIFFMLTLTTLTPQALSIDLPTSNHADEVLPQIKVTITADLAYYVDEQKISREQLKSVLQEKIATGQQHILLQIDQNLPIAQMIFVTDLAASLQAKLAIATKPEL